MTATARATIRSTVQGPTAGGRWEGAVGHPGGMRGRWLVGVLGALLVLAGLLGGAARGLVIPQLGPSLRLRVVGASNAPAEQQVKLAVRDAVLQQIAPALAHARTAAQATALVQARLDRVQRVASAVAGRFGERASVRLGSVPFPVERIGWLVFPAGRYPALAIYLGAARGHNWWTVLFPPLAFVAIGKRLDVVGPTGQVNAADRATIWSWMRGGVAAHGPGGLTGARVQVRFALWDLARGLGHDFPAWWRAWLRAAHG